MWTQFRDSSTGRILGYKVGFKHIFIELPQRYAEQFFIDLFEYNPYNRTCSCCGPDFSIYEDDTLEEITRYERHDYRDPEMRINLGQSVIALRDFEFDSTILILRKEDVRRIRRQLREGRPVVLPKPQTNLFYSSKSLNHKRRK